jgi:hypothetical protein
MTFRSNDLSVKCHSQSSELRADEQTFLERFEFLLSRYKRRSLILGDFNINTFLDGDGLVND